MAYPTFYGGIHGMYVSQTFEQAGCQSPVWLILSAAKRFIEKGHEVPPLAGLTAKNLEKPISRYGTLGVKVRVSPGQFAKFVEIGNALQAMDVDALTFSEREAIAELAHWRRISRPGRI